jgi:adenylosuccinate synthase
MPQAYLVIDGMWGSTGKGLLAGKLACDRAPDVVVCNFGPNAGHTFVDGRGRKIMTQQLPTGFMSPELRHLLIGPGAVIDPEILAKELEAFPEAKSCLAIHENASVVLPEDKAAEKESLVHVGSTRKGTAAGAARKAARPAKGVRIAREHPELRDFCVSAAEYDAIIRCATLVQVESAQGIELSLDRGFFYPYTTGRNVTPERILDDVAVPLRFLRETCMVIRSYPIRVGNEYDAKTGKMIGTSGPVYPDMTELTWEEMSKRTGTTLLERTTVTNKVRRIFSFSKQQLAHALWVTGPASLFLNFANYLDAGASAESRTYNVTLSAFLHDLHPFLSERESRLRWIGFGPRYQDVREL